jgi:hypothetical protein
VFTVAFAVPPRSNLLLCSRRLVPPVVLLVLVLVLVLLVLLVLVLFLKYLAPLPSRVDHCSNCF